MVSICHIQCLRDELCMMKDFSEKAGLAAGTELLALIKNK